MSIDGARILITGGTGSLGNALVDYIFMTYKPEKVVIFSRNEKAQCEMEDRFAYFKDKLRFILGSVTDRERISRACNGIDILIHAAALKVVPKLEYNPLECHDVNVEGTENAIFAAIGNKVPHCIYIGTDKGVMPVNYYGYTKGTAERMWLEANYLAPQFKIVRYGNVMGSAGSVLNRYLDLRKSGAKEFPITHLDCTRFWVDFKEAVSLIVKVLNEKAGTILASKVKAFRVKDLIKAVYLRSEIKIMGLREGEKIHETLVSEYEAPRTKEMQDFYRVFPAYSYDDTILYDKEHGADLKKAIVSNDPELLMGLDEIRRRLGEKSDAEA